METQEKSDFKRELKEFTEGYEQWLDDTLSRLGWDKGQILQNDKTSVICPVDSSHAIPESSLAKHLEYCPLVTQGYSREELDQQHSSQKYYEPFSNIVSINIDGNTLDTILARTMPGMIAGGPKKREMPATLEREATEFSQDERLAIYQYCIETAKAANATVSIPAEELMFLEDGSQEKNKPKSELERLAMMRDLRRRRQSYKGKSTHTSKKSHLEVIKEVIENQTEMLGRMWQEQSGIARQLSAARSESNGRMEENVGQLKEKHIQRDDNNRREVDRRSESRPTYEEKKRRRSRSKERDKNGDKEKYSEKDRDHDRYYEKPRSRHRYSDNEEFRYPALDKDTKNTVGEDRDTRDRFKDRRKRSRSRSQSRSRNERKSRDRSRHGKHKHKKHKKSKHADEES